MTICFPRAKALTLSQDSIYFDIKYSSTLLNLMSIYRNREKCLLRENTVRATIISFLSLVITS